MRRYYSVSVQWPNVFFLRIPLEVDLVTTNLNIEVLKRVQIGPHRTHRVNFLSVEIVKDLIYLFKRLNKMFLNFLFGIS